MKISRSVQNKIIIKEMMDEIIADNPGCFAHIINPEWANAFGVPESMRVPPREWDMYEHEGKLHNDGQYLPNAKKIKVREVCQKQK